MGKVGKGIGRFLGQAASVAAPFIPGVGGLVAGAVGSLGQQGREQRQADRAAGQIDAFAQRQMGAYDQLLPALQREAGVSDPNYNPYAALADSLYNPAAVSARASQLFDPAMLTGDMVAQQEATDTQFDNAVSAIEADSIRRGMGYGDPAAAARGRDVRLAQAASNAGFRRDLLARNMEQRRGYETQQEGARADLLTAGARQRQQNLGELGRMTASGAQGALGTVGGLQGMYQDRANQTGAGVGELVGQVARSGVKLGDLGSIFRRRRSGRNTPQSQSPGTTAAQAPSPIGGPSVDETGTSVRRRAANMA